MAGAAGRRNILRELTTLGDRDAGVNFQNASLPLTPTSPDETVIRQRGHQRKSATYNYNASDPVFFKTPTKSPKRQSLHKLNSPLKTPVRSSPRKRVNGYPDRTNKFEEGIAEMSISFKRMKKVPFQIVKPKMQFDNGLKALSRAQLVELISTATQSSPEIKKVFEDLIPTPDLLPLEQRLHTLQRNIFKSFPRNVWGSQDDSFCFVRVRTHLETFKKECLDMCQELMESQHWPAIFEYIIIAWKFTMGLPNWSNVSHNKIKSLCMKQLAAQFVSAMKEANLDKPSLTEIIERMQTLEEDASVKTCLTFATELLEKAS